MKWPLSLILSMAVWISSCAAILPQPSKPKLIEQTVSSIVKLRHPLKGNDEGHFYVCTGFVVGVELVLTAKHCVDDDLTVDELPADVLRESDSLALVKVPGLRKGPLTIRKETLKMGDDVLVIGYGYNFLNAFSRMVATPVFDGQDVVLDGLVINGMSGGPVIDMEGKVVGIVQSTQGEVLSFLCGQDEMRKFLKK